MKDWAFELFTWMCFILYLTLLGAILTGCSNKYDECMEKEKAEYRERNPKASYSQITARQKDFELSCSRLK